MFISQKEEFPNLYLYDLLSLEREYVGPISVSPCILLAQ